MVVTPHCEGLRWIVHYTGEQIRNVWIWLGGYLVWYVGNQITPFINTFRTNIYSNNNNEQNSDDVEPTNVSNIIETESVANEYNNIRRRTRNNNYTN